MMGLGPCGERAHLLRSVVGTRRALYQRPKGRDVARVPWARGVDAEDLGGWGNGWIVTCSEVREILAGAART